MMNNSSFWHTWLSNHLDLTSETIDRLVDRFERVNLTADAETLEHNLRAVRLACDLAEKVGLSDAQKIALQRGAVLHDLGKLLIPPEILEKPGALTPDEWAVIKRHPYFSYLLLCDIPELAPALDIPTTHHECWDGSGYPRGLKGEWIPLAARIFMIVDVWDALISPRPYRGPFAADEARTILAKLSGKQFDPRILNQFMEILPVGSS